MTVLECNVICPDCKSRTPIEFNKPNPLERVVLSWRCMDCYCRMMIFINKNRSGDDNSYEVRVKLISSGVKNDIKTIKNLSETSETVQSKEIEGK